MHITREQRQELNQLSKDVFGKTSFWYNKLYKTGVKRLKEDTTGPGSNWRYFFGYEDIKEYLLRVQANSKELLEKMKVETDTNGTNK